jgi:xanthine dehydrogenase accessory factor
LERLRTEGFSDTDISRIKAPIGLPIGAISPAEIALSILGEITATLRLKADGTRATR